MDKLATDGIAVLVPPESGKRKGQRPGWSGGRYSVDASSARQPITAASSTDNEDR